MAHRDQRHRTGRWRRAARRAAVALCAFGLVCGPATSALADDGPDAPDAPDGEVGVPLNNGQCNFPADPITGTPWSLQRLLLDQMWEDTRGENVTVAVIDSGVNRSHPQLKGALVKGADVVDKKGDGTADTAGHGTKVAGIIAARPARGTGFVGIAPAAKILPIRQNDPEKGGVVRGLIEAIDIAIAREVQIINISQGTSMRLPPNSALHKAIERAQAADILVVSSAGNDGASGAAKDTYPASIDGVLGVAASDRNNERAAFSQPGSFVDLAAPGVDMVSTVPIGGHCVDHGTSFAAPYAAGVAALVRSKHPKWTYEQVIWHLQRTADRVRPDRDQNVGWGVVDPVAAMTDDDEPPTGEPEPDKTELAGVNADNILPAPLILGETPQERRVRYGLYIFTGGVMGVAIVIGTSVALRDWRRKTAHHLHGEATHG
ncbi:type VII secretion-associated serine protease mycosin [Streptomyces durbertensis]|uniref:Type VII secretion-associated serine protease mycosin n=1 Tax=Streptomyces durbertensis TaxID=2448886 RepID=A0ABR6EHP0_9ACTN|nr:type VII secretion-associated serine protease mycosin [Streptomyces durbertensis]MBB1244778.1 type VII secretion-associated serine protease mycosin [Streptomyces durbertensis]